ncbi:DUF6332 family protein [Streptomyces venezuelae]|uniref:DUF6332 family protein n=1 Tax=Streptomyces venezuelae TaxID=54571 RepID=UPI003653B094
MGRRTQAERDADTVEIAYALFVAASLAGGTMLAVASPAFFFGVRSPGEGTLVRAGMIAGVAVFLAVLVAVLLRHGRAPRPRDPSDQPSQPGRTSPDS